MRFGVFDHLDRGGPDLAAQYEQRLRLVEAYDHAGLYAYHLAEHHGTPLGLSPSPSVFLSAVAQHTTRLRFGPLVYTLSLYHPLRLLEEICMLDNLSGGRLELGIGRGISPIELGFYGIGEDAQERYGEALEVILRGLRGTTLSFEGTHFSFRDVPVQLSPVQRPHPPLWYGVARPETTAWCAAHAVNAVCNGPVAGVRAITDRYRAEWQRAGRSPGELPLLGMSRHVVIADTDAEARDLLRPAYAGWFASLTHLWELRGIRLPLDFPSDPDAAADAGFAVAGSVATVRDALLAQASQAGVTYLLARMAFGELPLEVSLRSVELLRREVVPAFGDVARAA